MSRGYSRDPEAACPYRDCGFDGSQDEVDDHVAYMEVAGLHDYTRRGW